MKLIQTHNHSSIDHYRRQIAKHNQRLEDKSRALAPPVTGRAQTGRASADHHMQAVDLPPELQRHPEPHVYPPTPRALDATMAMLSLLPHLRPDLAAIQPARQPRSLSNNPAPSNPAAPEHEGGDDPSVASASRQGDGLTQHHIQAMRVVRDVTTPTTSLAATALMNNSTVATLTSAHVAMPTKSLAATALMNSSTAAILTSAHVTTPTTSLAATALDGSATAVSAFASVTASMPRSVTAISQSLLADAFVSYVKKFISFDDNTSTRAALKAYLHSGTANHRNITSEESLETHHEKHPFFQDWELQDYLLDKLDWYRPGSMLFHREPHIQHILAHGLTRALTADIDFSKIRGGYPVIYKDHVFRGITSLPILTAKHHALRCLTHGIQDELRLSHHHAEHLAKILLAEMDPALALIKKDIPGMKYFDHQYTALYAGEMAIHQLGLNPRAHTVAEMQALGQSFIRNTARSALQGGTPAATQLGELPLQETVLLRIACAKGLVDVETLSTQSPAEVTQFFENFINEEFKEEIAIEAALEKLIEEPPTRRRLAAKILRDMGEDPHRMIEVSGGNIAASFTESQTLRDIYLDRHVSTQPLSFTAIVGEANRNLIRNLPDINEHFNLVFDTYKRDYIHALTSLLKAQLIKNLEIGEDVSQVTFTLQMMDIFYENSATTTPSGFGYIKTYASVRGGYDADPELKVPGNDAFFIKKESSAGMQYFYFSKSQFAQGLQSLPKNTYISTHWGITHAREISETDAQYRGVNDARVVSASIRNIAAGDINFVLQTGVEKFVSKHVITQAVKEHAYGESHLESSMNTLHEMIVPFLGLYRSISKGNTDEAIFNGLFDLLGVLPIFGAGAKLIGGGIKLGTQAVARGMQGAVKHGVHVGMRKTFSTLAKGAPQLAVNSKNFAISLLELSPIPIPVGSAKLPALSKTRLVDMAEELQAKSPSLAKRVKLMARDGIYNHGQQWVIASDDLASIQTKYGKSTYEVAGRQYPVAQIDGQTVILKKHYEADGAYVTRVNPWTDHSFSQRLQLSSEGKVYLSDKASDTLLHGYAAPVSASDVSVDHNIVAAYGAQHTYLSLDGQRRYIHIGDGINNKYYQVERPNERGFDIFYPQTAHATNHIDPLAIVPDPPKQAVEVIDGKWQLVLDNVPEEFKSLTGTETRTWQFHGQGEELTVARLTDGRIVALKEEGARTYREVDWATGKPYANRSTVFKDTDGVFTQSGLAGGMPRTVAVDHLNKIKGLQGRISDLDHEYDLLTEIIQKQEITFTSLNKDEIFTVEGLRDRTIARWLNKNRDCTEGLTRRVDEAHKILTELKGLWSEVTTKSSKDEIAILYYKVSRNYVNTLAVLQTRQADTLVMMTTQLTNPRGIIGGIKDQSLVDFLKTMILNPTTEFNKTGAKKFIEYLESAVNDLRTVYKKYKEQKAYYDDFLAAQILPPHVKQKLLDFVKKEMGTLSMPMRHFISSNDYARSLSIKNVQELFAMRTLLNSSDAFLISNAAANAAQRGAGNAAVMLSTDFVSKSDKLNSSNILLKMQKHTDNQFLIAEQMYAEVVINLNYEPKEATRLFDIGERSPSLLSTKEQISVLNRLDEQYKTLNTEYAALAEQAVIKEFLSEKETFNELANFMLERQTDVAQTLEKVLANQPAPVVPKVPAKQSASVAKKVLASQRVPAAPSEAAAVAEGSVQSTSSPRKTKITTESGDYLVGEVRDNNKNIVDIKDSRNTVLAEYQYDAAREVWVKTEELEVDNLVELDVAFPETGDVANTGGRFNNLKGHYEKLHEEVVRLIGEEAMRRNTALYMENHGASPKAVEDILLAQCKVLDNRAEKVVKIKERFQRMRRYDTADADAFIGKANTDINSLADLSRDLRNLGKEIRLRMIYRNIIDTPDDVSLRYLKDVEPFKIQITPAAERKKIARDWINEYTITITFDNGERKNVYAHFHYKNPGDPDASYTAAHYKNEQERFLGKNWEQQEGNALRVYRAGVSRDGAEKLFSLG